MGLWPDTATALAELRGTLSDGPTNRHIKDKLILRPVDGANTFFQTVEDRLVSPAAGSPIAAPGVIVRVAYDPVTVASVDYLGGGITLATAPPQGVEIKAEYYYQFFLDSELTTAMQRAAGMILGSENFLLIQDGLKLGCQYLAASIAYQQQAARWVERLSNAFMAQEQPLDVDTLGRPNLFQSLANSYYKLGIAARDDFYTRQGRRNAPAIARYAPKIGPIGPTR